MNIKKTIIIMALPLCFAACNRGGSGDDSNGNPESPAEKYQKELLYTNVTDSFELSLDNMYEVYKFRTPDGYVIEDSSQYAPRNEGVRVFDPQGRLYAVGGKASECMFFDCVKFLYGENDEVTGLLALPYVYGTVDDRLVDEALDSNIIEDWQFSINSFYFLAFEADNDGLYFSRYYFRRDSAGRIDKVYDPIQYQSITAPYNHHFEYEVRKSDGFWYSDLLGGGYDVIFRTVPNDSDVYEPVRKTYYGYKVKDQSDKE